ncbi:MAG: hypothetical protein MR997_03645 [Bacteroidales bacterium]|nr:hypothetical protein [Bacteroidales bacterium]
MTPNPNTEGEYYTKTPVYVNGSNNDYDWSYIIFTSSDGKYYKKDGNNTLKVTTDYYAKTNGSDNIPTTLEEKKAYTFYFKPSENEAKVYVAEAYDVVYLKGGMSEWKNNDKYKFSTTDGNEYTLEVDKLDANTEFKVVNDVRNEWLGTSELTISGFASTSTSDGNIKNTEALSNVKFVYNKSANTLKVESLVAADTYKLNIGGTEVTMSTSDNGATYTASSTLSAGKTISLVNSTSGTTLYPSESATYKGGEATYTMDGAEGNTITTDNVNNASFSGNYTFTYTVNPGTLVVNGAAATYTYDKYYVKYSSDGWKSHEMTRQKDGTYTYVMNNPSSGCELAMQKNGTNEANDFWTDAENNTYTGGSMDFSMKNHDKRQSKNIKFGEVLSGDYLLTYNPTTETLTISGAAVASNDLAIGFGDYTYAPSDNLWNGSSYNSFTINKKNGEKFRIYSSDGKVYGPASETEISETTYSDLGESKNYFVVPDDQEYVVTITSYADGKVSAKVVCNGLVTGNELAIAGDAVGTGYSYDAGIKLWNSSTGSYNTTLICNNSGSVKYFKFYNKNKSGFGPAQDGTLIAIGDNFTANQVNTGAWKVPSDGKCYLVTVLSYDGTTVTYKVEEKQPTVALVTNLSAKLDQSVNNGWVFKNGVEMTAGETATVVTDPSAAMYFRFIDEDNNHYYPETAGEQVTDKDYTTKYATTTTNTYSIAQGEGEIYIKLIEFKKGEYVKFKVFGVAGSEYRFRCSKDGWTEFSKSPKFEYTSPNTLVYTTSQEGTDVDVEFGFARDTNGDNNQDEWYYAVEKGVSITAPGNYTYDLVKKDGQNLHIKVAGTYVFVLNLNENGVATSVTIDIDGGEASHKPYYFVGDMNDWFSAKFADPNAEGGINQDLLAANKDNWKFTYIDTEDGLEGNGWYKFMFGDTLLTGQFQVFDGTSAGWNGDVYSHNPKVSNSNQNVDAGSFKNYITNPISREMIKNQTPMTKSSTPGIRRGQGSNFHMQCNAVKGAIIYFKPGDDPKLIVKGEPVDFYVFYSSEYKNDLGDEKVVAQIENEKPNTNNYYLPGVVYANGALSNYIDADGKTAEHMNTEGGVVFKAIDFSKSQSELEDNADFKALFINDGKNYVGESDYNTFISDIVNNKKLPNGISIDGRPIVYVAEIPSGFEYPAGRKYALKFLQALNSKVKDVQTPVAANNLYFFKDAVHVLLNVDNYDDGAEQKGRFVEHYYRIYTYDASYNTIVITDPATDASKIMFKSNQEIAPTAGSDTENEGWVRLDKYEASPLIGAPTTYSKWHYAYDSENAEALSIPTRYGNCYVQFKIVTGPKPSSVSAANRANAEESDSGTLYIPERALIRNTPEFYTFNGKDLYVALDGGYTTTGVEDVFEDQIVEEGVDAEPIFFNLQGQRVVNPEKGMYIVVKGNKTYKVMIK